MNVLSFLRARRRDDHALAAAPRCRDPLRELAWDGHVLTLVLDAAAAAGHDIALDLDGHFFASTTCDRHGCAQFAFVFSPSGHDDSVLLPRLRRDGAVLTESAAHVRSGRPGIRVAPSPTAKPTPIALAALSAPARMLPMRAIGLKKRAIAIIVPVYNAAPLVERCLDAVVANTHGAARLIVIDDASSEPEIAAVLARYRDIANVDILRNACNLGFTATANRGMRHAADADVVLLNADTEVGPNWLTGLQRAAYAADDVATATAVSDNAGAFSVPELEQANDLPSAWTFAQCARAVWQAAGLAYPELPTGNGFCMFIRREVIERVGLFDEAAFAQGYGEENDFCQRAAREGWRHVIAGNVLVGHARSMSFGDERRVSLGRAGMAILRERYPDYENDVARTLYSFERRVLDWRVRARFATATADNAPKPRVLAVGGDIGHTPDHALWRVVERGDDLELVGPDGVTADRVAVSARESALACWVQLHAIEVLVGDAAAIAALTDFAATLGIVVAAVPVVDTATALAPIIEHARQRARSFVREAQ